MEGAVAGDDGGDVYDAAAGRGEVGEGGLEEEEGAADVGLEVPVEGVEGDGFDIVVEGAGSGVVD